MKYLKNTNLSKAVSENRERKKHVVTSTELVWHWGLTKTAQEKKTADQYSSWKVTWMSLCCARLSHSVVSDSLWPHWLQPASLLCSWDSSGKNTGVGCPAFLQGIFPTQGWTQVSWIAGQFFTIWAHQESPGILEWVAYPFSRGSSQPWSRTEVSHVAADSLPAELPGKPYGCL